MEIRLRIEIAAPLEIVYGRCRQVEDLPALFPALLEVTPEEPNGIRYRVVVGSPAESFALQVEITEVGVDRILAWRHLDGPLESGSIGFSRASVDRTLLDFSVVPRGEVDAAGVERVLRCIATGSADLPPVVETMRDQRRDFVLDPARLDARL